MSAGPMRFGSVCSGIEAASVAWSPLGWRASFVSEIDRPACAVLEHHYPDTPNRGDMTKWESWPDATLDVLVGGTPCQSFSVAGLRRGLDDPRGSLMLTFGAIARRYRPKWLVWENVPGVLSSDGGRDFGTFLGMLGLLGYGFAYRVLDAQYFGLAQRRARVFVVGYLGDWRPPAAVLFERESLSGNPAPRREAGETAPTIPSRSTAGGGLGTDFDCDGGLRPWPHDVAGTLDAHYGDKMGLEDQHVFNQHGSRFVPAAQEIIAFGTKEFAQDAGDVSPPLRAMGHDKSHQNGGGQVAVAFNWQGGGTQTTLGYDPDSQVSGSLHVGQTPAIAFDTTQVTSKTNRSNPQPGDACHPLAAGAHAPAVAFNITPSNSNKDFNARESQRAQALTAGGNRPSARGGDLIAEPFTLAIRGRGDSHDLEYRTDGTANALLTPNGGRAGIGVGAIANTAVRRLTPRECERLQGFPDDYTLVPYRGKTMADGPRYKMLGNSMAVPVMRWIGSRIESVRAIMEQRP